MTNKEIRMLIQAMTAQVQVVINQAQAMTAQAYREVIDPANIVNLTDLRVREFLRMKPQDFYGSKVEEYTQCFIYEVYKVLAIMWLTSIEKEELVAY